MTPKQNDNALLMKNMSTLSKAHMNDAEQGKIPKLVNASQTKGLRKGGVFS